MELISVIVPVKNDLGGMRRLLDCLAHQTVDHELIVVDNGSTDGTREFVESLGVRLLCCPGVKVGALRNKGVQISKCEFLAFADSDHEVGPAWLETGLVLLQSNLEIAACGSHYLPPPSGTWVQKAWSIHRLRNTRFEEVDWLASGNLFVRRNAFMNVNGFSESLTAAEDVDLCHRLRGQGGKIVHDPSIASIHHGEAATLIHFIRKEWWRGSSGIRAWISQGFPLRELPSLIWPVWHLFFGLLMLFFLSFMAWSLSASYAAIGSTLIGVAWLFPSVLLGFSIGRSHGFICVLQLWVLYFVYGNTRGFALFRK